MGESIPREQRRSERKWYWEEVDPKTQTVIGVFEAADNIRYKPSLLKKTASAAMEGFGVRLEDVNEIYDRTMREFAELKGLEYDPDALKKAVIDGLRAGDPEETRAVISELGSCASKQTWSVELASEVADQLMSDDNPYEAMPVLQALSTLAMYRLALEKHESGFVYVAYPPHPPIE